MAASRRRLGDDDGDQLGDDGVEMTTASSLKTTTTARPLLLPWIAIAIAIVFP
jgi:hypothetical protein